MRVKCYSELISFPTYEERLEYLQLNGRVGEDTFGWDRYLNQTFYKSKRWERIRDSVILRDLGCDLGIQDREICGPIYIHHINPITKEDIENMSQYLISPEYLISTSLKTHNLIHYGWKVPDIPSVLERTPNDTCPWR